MAVERKLQIRNRRNVIINIFIPMKIEKQNITELMSKHIFLLSEKKLKALAFLLDIEISDYSKSDWQVKFKMKHKMTTVFVECSKGSNVSMGKSNKVKNSLSGLTSWGGVFSFANTVKTFRGFFTGGYELTFQSPEKHEFYTREEWRELVPMADELVQESD